MTEVCVVQACVDVWLCVVWVVTVEKEGELEENRAPPAERTTTWRTMARDAKNSRMSEPLLFSVGGLDDKILVVGETHL